MHVSCCDTELITLHNTTLYVLTIWSLFNERGRLYERTFGMHYDPVSLLLLIKDQRHACFLPVLCTEVDKPN